MLCSFYTTRPTEPRSWTQLRRIIVLDWLLVSGLVGIFLFLGNDIIINWFRKSSSRFITVIRQQAGVSTASTVLQITMNSRQQMVALMQRCPLNSKERHDLIPRSEKSQNTQGMMSFNSYWCSVCTENFHCLGSASNTCSQTIFLCIMNRQWAYTRYNSKVEYEVQKCFTILNIQFKLYLKIRMNGCHCFDTRSYSVTAC